MQQHSRARRLVGIAAASIAAAFGASSAHALTLFDDFTATSINPHWDGNEHTQYGATLSEARRAIQSGALRIEVKGWSDRFNNTGTGRVRNEVIFENSATITEMKATVTPRTMAPGTCAGNQSPGYARARLIGGFFNIGIVKPGNEFNDVLASIQIVRASDSIDPAGVLRVFGAVYLCTDSECINSSTVGSVELGTTTLNTPTDLHVTWDKANKQFIFQKGTEAAQNVVYTFAGSQAPQYNAKRLEAVGDIPNCSAARAATATFVDFDSVYTN